MVAELAAAWPGDFLLGTVHFDQTGDFNSALLLAGRGEEFALHHKIHLVPFGEYVPFRASFPLFAWIIGDLVPSDFDAGENFTVFQLERVDLRVGPLICFEDTLGELGRRFVQAGAQLFVVLTNDGWFGESAGSRQHLAQSVFRSAENKIPMLRAANTGMTCWIDRHGQVIEVLATPDGNTFIEGTLFGEFPVPTDAADTFYTRHGEIFSQGCLVLCLLGAGFFLGSSLFPVGGFQKKQARAEKQRRRESR
jgi:apolipoprotein N-acyltransferase